MHAKADFYSRTVFWAKIALVAALLAVLAVHLAYYFNFGGAFSGTKSDWGTFGDYLGGSLGPILNLISIGMLVMTLQFQRQQITEAKEEASLAKANAAMQQHTLSRQAFEQTFFSWLRSYREIVSAITMPTGIIQGVTSVEGRYALSAIWDSYINANFIVSMGKSRGESQERIIESINGCMRHEAYDHNLVGLTVIACYEQLYIAHHSSLDTMLRTLYRLIKWIDNAEMRVDEKFNYVGVVRAQVSNVELWFLMINALTERGEKFFPLLNKYAFLENMDIHPFIRPLRHIYVDGRVFHPAAFDSELARDELALTS